MQQAGVAQDFMSQPEQQQEDLTKLAPGSTATANVV
jgi:hypothetical protein